MEKSSETHSVHAGDELLTKFKLFAELAPDELSALIAQSNVVTFAQDTRIIAAGEPGYCMYVVLRGSVRVSITNDHGAVDLATLQPGDFFGEVALVDDGPRSADVTAIEDCQLLCITRMTLGVLAGLQPGAAIQLLAAIGRNLVARLREGNQKYMDLIVLSQKSA